MTFDFKCPLAFFLSLYFPFICFSTLYFEVFSCWAFRLTLLLFSAKQFPELGQYGNVHAGVQLRRPFAHAFRCSLFKNQTLHQVSRAASYLYHRLPVNRPFTEE